PPRLLPATRQDQPRAPRPPHRAATVVPESEHPCSALYQYVRLNAAPFNTGGMPAREQGCSQSLIREGCLPASRAVVRHVMLADPADLNRSPTVPGVGYFT